MVGWDRAQSETIGVVFLVALVVMVMALVGTMLFTSQAQQIRGQDDPAEFQTELNETSLTLTHKGGRAIQLAALDLVLREGSSERLYDLDDSADLTSEDLNGNNDFEAGESVTVSHNFTGDVRIMLVETKEGGDVLYDEFKAIDGPRTSPKIERFEITDTSTDTDASYDVTWNASDNQGDITDVTVELIDQESGVVQDSKSTSFGGVAATGVQTNTLTNTSGSGELYTIKLTVTDGAGNTVTGMLGDTADSRSGLRPPTIETYSVTDNSSGNEVKYEYTYNASDPDGDLNETTVDLINTTSNDIVDTVTDNYPQVDATGIQTGNLTDPNTGKNDNQEYNITITVSDLEGNDVLSTVTDVADGGSGGGGAANPPSVDKLDVTDTTGTGKNADATFDVTWRASDPDGNLEDATLKLWSTKGNDQRKDVEDSVSYSSGDFTSGSDTGDQTDTLSDKNGAGKDYIIEIVVNDDTGNTATDSSGIITAG